jgi:hypothetical protein
MAVAGFALIHHHLLTGLQLQNYHWAYFFSPVFILLYIALIAAEIPQSWDARGSWGKRVIAGFVLIHLAAGIYLRVQEATRTYDSQLFTMQYMEYRDQRSLSGAHLGANRVVAGDHAFVYQAMVMDNLRPLDTPWPVVWSSSVSDDEFDQRISFNAVLLGRTRTEFEVIQRSQLEKSEFGQEKRSLEFRARRLASRLAYFDRATITFNETIDKFKIHYVALPSSQNPPDYLTHGWKRIEAGPTWQVWQRLSGG